MAIATTYNNGKAATNIDWGFALYSPTPARVSDAHPEWGSQHSLLVQRGDEQLRVYFKPGLLSHVQEGDALLLEFRKGKWRAAFSQPPELLQELQARQDAAQQQVPQSRSQPHSTIAPRESHAQQSAAPPQLQRPLSTNQLPGFGDPELECMAMSLMDTFRYFDARIESSDPNVSRTLAITCWIQYQEQLSRRERWREEGKKAGTAPAF